MMRCVIGLAAVALLMFPSMPSSLYAQGAAAPTRQLRSWVSSSRNYQVGEIVTVFVEERALAEEQTSRVASNDRGQSSSIASGGDFTLGIEALSFSSGMDQSSRARGEAGRSAGLRGVMSTRITEIDVYGNLKIEGQKIILIDGREQTWKLTGFVRAEDVSAANEVSSSRIAEATIEYAGQSISPSSGILGKILSIFWP